MIDIKDISGNIKLSVPVSEKAVHKKELMKEDYVLLTFNHDLLIHFVIGDYAEWNRGKFFVLENYIPEYSDGYYYELKLYAEWVKWKSIPLFYTKQTTPEADWSLTSTPDDFLKEVVANIFNFTGKTYTYSFDPSLTASQTLEFQSTSVLEALNNIANAWETEWWVEGTVIHISKCETSSSITLETGINVNPPTSIEVDTEYTYATRFYAFGSTRNITQDSTPGTIISSLVNKRLTLPESTYPNGYKDIKEHLSPDEIIVKTVIFDEIYPSSNLTISNVRANIKTDNTKQVGTDGSGNPIYNTYPIYYFKIPGYVFDKDNLIEGLDLSVNFQDGILAEREYRLNYHADTHEYEILFDESTGYIIPNLTLCPKDGDKVILFNIKMPVEYKTSAQTRLETALNDYISKCISNRNTYEFTSNPVEFYNNGTDLNVGQKVNYILDGEIIPTRVLSFEKRLDDIYTVIYKVGVAVKTGKTESLKQEVTNINQNVDAIKALSDLSKDIQNAYGRAQKSIADGLAQWGNMWVVDKSKDATSDKTDTSKWFIRTAFSIVSEKGISALGASLETGSGGGLTEEILAQWLIENGYEKFAPTKEWIINNNKFLRALTNSSGDITETKDQYLTRVTKEFRYVGLEVVLKSDSDATYTKFEFKNGIENYDFIGVKYFIDIKEYLYDGLDYEGDDKALSARQGKALMDMIIYYKSGTY